MKFPKIPPHSLMRRLLPPKGRVPVVLDTDTYNEVDDQFALAHAVLSQDRLDIQALYAAPFFNFRNRIFGDVFAKLAAMS